MRKHYFILVFFISIFSMQAAALNLSPLMITGNFSICLPGPGTTQLSWSGGSGVPHPLTPWVSSNPAVATVDNNGLVDQTGSATGMTTITFTDSNFSQVSQNVYVASNPSITSSTGSFVICPVSTIQLNGSLFPHPTTPWQSSNPAVASVNSIGEVTGLSTGTSVITYMNIGGCTKSQTITVQERIFPTVSCGIWSPNNSATFNWNALLGVNLYSISYTINGGSLISGSIGNFLSYTVNNVLSSDHVVLYVSPAGSAGSCLGTGISCQSTPPCPEAGVLSGVQNICIGNTTSFTSTVAGGTWSSSNTSIATVNPATGVVTGIMDGTATLTYTVLGSGGCPSASAFRTVTVLTGTTNLFCDSNNLPPNSVGFDWSPVLGATNYDISYSINGGPTQTANVVASNYQVSGVQPGQSVLFTVVTASGASCYVSTSTTCTLLADSDFDADVLSVYPNPVQNVLHIRDLKFVSDVSLFNTFGQQVGALNSVSNNCTFDMSSLADGLYFVKIITEEHTKTIKVIKS